jgi:YggT family protein
MISVLLYYIIYIYSWILFVYVLLTWIPNKTGWLGTINTVLESISEPYLKLFRKIIPPIGGVVDITPIIGFIVLQIVARLVLVIL